MNLTNDSVKNSHFDEEKQVTVGSSGIVAEEGAENISGSIIAIDDDGVEVNCGEGILKLTCIQIEDNEKVNGLEIKNSGVLEIGRRPG